MSTIRESCNMHIFHDIKINNEFSKYLKDLNRMYSKAGLKTFINRLKNQRIYLEEDYITALPSRKEKSR